jgi:adenine-specific DNA-methyltransferase
MPETTSAASTRARAARRQKVSAEVKELHRRCGVYTKVEVVCRILDAIGWSEDVDLSRACLLEPAAGDGAFVAEAARRLVASLRRRGIKLTTKTLLARIVAYELHAREAESARQRTIDALREAGVNRRTAEACARAWIITGDFLRAKLPLNRFTHAAGNPPYVRWSKIPSALRAKYESSLPKEMIGGDLFLPFLDRTLDALITNGRCGFICSDRWRFMAFAERFREKWLSKLQIVSETTLSATEAFTKDVDSYPTILIALKRPPLKKSQSTRIKKGRTIGELGYTIRVGPALGHTPAFVLERDEDDVETELLRPWVDGSEVQEGVIKWGGRRVITMCGSDGKLIDPKAFPKLKARLARFKKQLKQRSIVKNGAEWYTTIDRVISKDWKRPKILIPELAKVPRVAIDRTGKIPSHGVYAVFADDDQIEKLYEALRGGKLAKYLEGIAPKVKGGYVRCYKRFLINIVLDGSNLR